MAIFDDFSSAMGINPTVAKFVGGGLIVVYIGAVALSYVGNPKDASIMGGVLLAFALLVVVVMYIANNPMMRAVLGWSLTGVMVLFMGCFAESVLQLTGGRIAQTPCFIRMFTMSRESCERKFAPVIELIGPSNSTYLLDPSNPDARIWHAQSGSDPQHTITSSTPYTAGQVYLQISPPISLEASSEFAINLAQTGWAIAGGPNGAEVKKSHPNENEVRFFHQQDRDNAVELAKRVYELNPSAGVHVRDFTRLGKFAPKGNIEIWLNTLNNGIGG